MNRRKMLSLARNGFGSVALLGLASSLPLGNQLMAAAKAIGDPRKKGPHFLPKAKSVIFLYMDGGVSQVDAFDWKPRLLKEQGANPFDKFKVDATQFNNYGKLMAPQYAFKQRGESGLWISDLFPHIAECADDLVMIKSMVSNFPEHTNANYFLHTGIGNQGRPSMGAWITYGLGSENENLPGYIVLDGGLTPPGGLDNFKNGFLPASYQASVLRARATPLENIIPKEATTAKQQSKLALMRQLDQSLLDKLGPTDQIESTIANYELAFKMQTSVPEIADLSKESALIKKMYGMDSENEHTRGYAAQCLLARRLVERGVRFIELTCPNVYVDRWDQHNKLKEGHSKNAYAVDQPIAALLKDLKWSGLLEETLVVFAGEFGRTPFSQGKTGGRDHNPTAFSIWMAGAGLKKGISYGQTDEYGYRVIENSTTIHDLHATMLHLLGIDHIQQTYRFGGRDIRLTDVHGHVLKDILA